MNKKGVDKIHDSIYNCIYLGSEGGLGKEIKWNHLKSSRLKLTRGVSFEEIVHVELLDIIDHPSRNDQLILICKHKGYVWVVPFVFQENGIFLKTLYPSRKFKKLYRKR